MPNKLPILKLRIQINTLVNKVNFHLKSFFMSFGGICLMIMSEKLPRINKIETSHLLGRQEYRHTGKELKGRDSTIFDKKLRCA